MLITPEVVALVLERVQAGKKQLAVAREFEISLRTVSSIVAGEHCCQQPGWTPAPPAKRYVPRPPKPKVERKAVDATKPKRGKTDSGCKYLPSQEQIARECEAIRQMWGDWERQSREVYDHPERYEFPTVSDRLFGAA